MKNAADHESLVEIRNFPEIRNKSGKFAYGGSQHWFQTKWRRLAGCAPTTGAEMAAFFQIGIRPDHVAHEETPVFQFENFLNLMNQMFHYMKPGSMGYPHSREYVRAFESFARDHGAAVRGRRITSWANSEDIFKRIRHCIRHDTPVVMLILQHTYKPIDNDTWHWMIITGYDKDTRDIMISNYGHRQWMPADPVFEPKIGNVVKLITFEREQ